MTDQWHSQQERLGDQLFHPSILTQMRGSETQVGKSVGRAINQSVNAKLLDEPLELAGRSGALLEIDEMRLHSPFGEEPKCLAGIRILLESEDLDFHGGRI